jgi:cytochrome c
LACHSVANKIVGPAYKDVAAKYRGDKTAEAKLIAKVKAGGSGVWGPIPMPANSPQVKDEDIKTIVQWVLTL